MIDASLMTQVERLNTSERLELIATVWDSLDTAQLSISDAELTLIDQRLADAEQNPQAEHAWPEVRERLRRRLP